MAVRETSRPSVEPVTLEEARLWCRIVDDDTTQDAILLGIIQAARKRCEEITGLCCAVRTFTLTLDAFPAGDLPIELPWAPLVSVQSVVYVDSSGLTQTLSGSPDAVRVDTNSMPGRIVPLLGSDWPGTYAVANAVTVNYTAGYSNMNDIPPDAKLWMQSRISTWFDNRDHVFVGNTTVGPRDWVDGLLDPLRVRSGFA